MGMFGKGIHCSERLTMGVLSKLFGSSTTEDLA